MPHQTIYRRDLAYLHHVGFGDFARKSARGLLRILNQEGIRRGRLIDLGCGSGLWARAAHRAGFNVLGVDQSPAMICLAREVAPGARFRCASLHESALPACDAITAIGEGLNYLSPGRRKESPLLKLFRRVATALRPDGVFIFDVMTGPGKPVNGRNWRKGKNWVVLTEVDEKSAGLLIRRIVIFRKVRSTWRCGEEIHRIRLFRPAKIRQALRMAGFSIRTTRHYGEVSLLPRRLAFIARKPG